MCMFRQTFYLTLLLFFWAPSVVCAQNASVSGVVKSIINGQSFELENGKRIRLAGIEAPHLSLNNPTLKSWPLAEESYDFLETLILGQKITAHHNRQDFKDRNGYILAHVYLDQPKAWVQEAMLKAGMARVQTYVHTRNYAEQMYKHEDTARTQKNGIWSRSFYKVYTHNWANKYIGRYQIIRGVVKNVTATGDKTYLNFGLNWRTDFTIAIDKKHLKLFETQNINPSHLKGREVVVRGWIRDWNGPLIDVSHPEQIQLAAGLTLN